MAFVFDAVIETGFFGVDAAPKFDGFEGGVIGDGGDLGDIVNWAVGSTTATTQRILHYSNEF